MADVVRDSPGGGLRGPFIGPVVERHRTGQAVGGGLARRVGEMGKGSGQADLQPGILGMDADGLVAPRLVGFAVGPEEQPSCSPERTPLLGAETGGAEVVAGPGEAGAT